MATPTYKGAGQPATSSGWLSGIGSSFGTAAPAYGAAPQPAAASTAPAAAVSTTTTAAAPASAVFVACEPDRIVFVIPRELIDAQKLAEAAVLVGAVPQCEGDKITFVIPRQ
jgi:hypothetical protein